MPDPPFPSIAGRWQVVAVNGQPVAGTASFEPPQFSISFGCNDARGGYRQERDLVMAMPPIGMTERGCVNADDSPSVVMQREEEGFRTVTRNMRIAFYGPSRARLSNEAGTIDLVRP
jgi:heat shock protein HslJ